MEQRFAEAIAKSSPPQISDFMRDLPSLQKRLAELQIAVEAASEAIGEYMCARESQGNSIQSAAPRRNEEGQATSRPECE